VEGVQEKVEHVERLGACVRGGGGGSHLEDGKELQGAHDGVAARDCVFLGFDLLQFRHLKQGATKKKPQQRRSVTKSHFVFGVVQWRWCVWGGGGGKYNNKNHRAARKGHTVPGRY
jgi:hypothetical protein